MHHRKKPEVDVILDILNAGIEAFPHSEFIRSMAFQYQERGGLSKKQLEGLYKKVSRLDTIPPARLATLEAEILKKPTRYKSELPPPSPVYQKDEATGTMIGEILAKFPQHKRVLFFKTKYDNNEVLSAADLTELKKFHSLAARK